MERWIFGEGTQEGDVDSLGDDKIFMLGVENITLHDLYIMLKLWINN